MIPRVTFNARLQLSYVNSQILRPETAKQIIWKPFKHMRFETFHSLTILKLYVRHQVLLRAVGELALIKFFNA